MEIGAGGQRGGQTSTVPEALEAVITLEDEMRAGAWDDAAREEERKERLLEERQLEKRARDLAEAEAAEAADFDRRPVTEEELKAWARLTPDQREMFGGMLCNSFRRLLAREGDNLPSWIETAERLGVLVR
ncbi:MAG: hypothetical protein M3R02_17390 [Chloroflexota bacterium]|nr:hypothetical protein [Chloroflexota bacterium]